MRLLLSVLCCLTATCGAAQAGGACDPWLHKTVRATGDYVPAEEAYARSFVFGLSLDCNGARERVTVQRPTGRLPVCRSGQKVEVVGKLIWNSTLITGHYEINDPSSVACR